MSITKQTTIWCDGCGTWEQKSATALEIRQELRKKGWIVNFLETYERKDYCPACWEKRERGEK